MKIQVPPNRPVYPTPAALITCADEQGRPNILTLGEFWTLGQKMERSQSERPGT